MRAAVRSARQKGTQALTSFQTSTPSFDSSRSTCLVACLALMSSPRAPAMAGPMAATDRLVARTRPRVHRDLIRAFRVRMDLIFSEFR